MIRIAITSEGPTDVGKMEYSDKKRQLVFQKGPIPIYFNRILHDDNIEFVYVNRKDLDAADSNGRLRLQGHIKERFKGQTKHAMYFKKLANYQNVDVAVFDSDADTDSTQNPHNEHACQERYDQIKAEIQTGFEIATVAGATAEQKDCPGIAVVPVKMIESWMMADSTIFERVFGKRKTKEKIPARPELEWGSKDSPQSNYPKNQLKRIMEEFQAEPCQETFCELAMEQNLDAMSKSCPISFQPFYDDVKALKSRLGAKAGNALRWRLDYDG